MRKKEGNKEVDILNAALEVFAESGFFEARISKIAELANVSIGSVYVYYQSKDDLLYKIFDNIWGSMYDKLKSLYADDKVSAMDKYDAMIDMIFDTFTKSTATALVVAHEQQRILMRNPEEFTPHYENFVKLGEKIVKDGINSGIFNPEINVKIFRHFLLGAFRDLINSWAQNKKEFSLNLMRHNIKYITKHGLLKKE